jgi:Pyrimidine dimer DNA glycosylase
MRLWSLHPKHLDAKGLVALWREGLLALAVVRGQTRGYRHHPQLARFVTCRSPPEVLEKYLLVVHDEAQARGYRFDRSKLGTPRTRVRIAVTQGQLDFEWRHLLGKLERREPKRWLLAKEATPCAHPMFDVTEGPVETWEKTPASAPITARAR